MAEPVATVVIGRDFDFRSLREKAMLASDDNVRVYTYDDLHILAKHRQMRI